MSGSLLSLWFKLMISLSVEKTSDTMIEASSEAKYKANEKVYLFEVRDYDGKNSGFQGTRV